MQAAHLHGRLHRAALLAQLLSQALAAEEAALADVAAEPHAPPLQLEGGGAVEDDALGELGVVLEQQQHALVEVLLPQREAELLPRAPQQHRALLDQRRLVNPSFRVPGHLVTAALFGALLRDELGAEVPHVHVDPRRLVVVAATACGATLAAAGAAWRRQRGRLAVARAGRAPRVLLPSRPRLLEARRRRTPSHPRRDQVRRGVGAHTLATPALTCRPSASLRSGESLTCAG
mmetsp:Transcript_13227/g.48178  ORF Transcript_13227/g.48178 Transcript_13227/m.48178 type:complete len:233 (-) Transcript_13227:35-733(-)